MRTVFWDEQSQKLKMIDQSCLPAEYRLVEIDTCQGVANAIRSMVIRGAPAIGVAAAFGMALAARES
ncbi:MAG: S-methyl-5-thioribose-1-phosphate isomerase, partial [Anaerolineaceae bacterium]